MAGWGNDYQLLGEEVIQRRDEGCVIPAWISETLAARHPQLDAWNDEALEPLWQALARLAPDPELAQREPDELAAIRALRPDGPRDLHWQPDAEEIYGPGNEPPMCIDSGRPGRPYGHALSPTLAGLVGTPGPSRPHCCGTWLPTPGTAPGTPRRCGCAARGAPPVPPDQAAT